MTGLILKDIFNSKRQLRIFIILLCVYAVLGFYMENGAMLTSMLLIICMMLVMNSFGYDEQNDWNKYALTLALDRKDIVKSKYILSLILIVLSVVASLIINLIYYLVADMSLKESFYVILIVGSFFILGISIMIPVFFKWGVQKSSLITMLVFAVPIAVVVALGSIMSNLDAEKMSTVGNTFMKILDIGKYFIPLILVLAVIISYTITMKIFRNKEL